MLCGDSWEITLGQRGFMATMTQTVCFAWQQNYTPQPCRGRNCELACPYQRGQTLMKIMAS